MSSGIIFDLDETLIDRRAGLSQYASKFWQANSAHFSLSESAFVQIFIDRDGNGHVPRKEFFGSLCKDVLSFTDPNALADHFFSHAWLFPPLFPQVKSLLQALRIRGYRLGIVSNGSQRAQLAKLKNSGLDKLVDAYVISETFGASKPDPAIYQEIVSRLDIHPETSWFIGDSPVADVIGPTKLGFKTVWISRYNEWPSSEPRCYTKYVGSIAEVLALIDVVPLEQ